MLSPVQEPGGSNFQAELHALQRANAHPCENLVQMLDHNVHGGWIALRLYAGRAKDVREMLPGMEERAAGTWRLALDVVSVCCETTAVLGL